MTLNVDKTNALKAWIEADSKGKKMLENLYGESVFQNQNVIDRVKTFEDALKETGRPDVPDFSCLPSDMRKYFEAQYKMLVITEALNEGWNPDWDDNNERKYYSWFIMSPSSFAFFNSSYDCSAAYAGGGSRLKFKTSELAEYAAIQFVDIWKNIQIG